MRRAFTLVELLVVIGIIGILSAALLGTFSGGTESAKSARCLSNLRNLAAACQSAGLARGYYPPAGSIERVRLIQNGGTWEEEYTDLSGWIAWNCRDAYKRDDKGHGPKSHQASASWNTSMYSSDKEARNFCLTNGVIWTYLGQNKTIYVCPSHANKMKGQADGLGPNFSYMMNAVFNWDTSKGQSALPYEDPDLITYGQLKRADRRLLFAEIPFQEIGDQSVPTDEGEETDSILQYKGCPGCGTPETIGFNHKSGKLYHGHVAFADGHVEKLIFPKAGIPKGELQDLTKWLCEGKDYSFNGSKYEELKE